MLSWKVLISAQRYRLKKFVRAALALLMVCAPFAPAFADATWTPAANDWVTGANWLPATAPGSVSGTVLNPDTATFSSTAGHTFTTVSVDNNRNLQNITFNAAAEAYTLMFTSGIFTFLLTADGVIQNNSSTANNQNINLNTQLNGAYTLNSNSNVSGDIYTMNFGKSFVSDSITQAVTGALTLGGANTGNNTISTDLKNGAGTLSLIKNGAGTWVLSGANSYTGGTNINGGVLQLTGAGTLGSTLAANTITLNGGTLEVASGVNSAFTTAQNITVASSGGTIQSDAITGITLTDSGSVSIASGNTLTVTGSGNTTLSGNLTGGSGGANGSFNKTGTGTLILSGTNSFNDISFHVTGGTLQLGSSGALGYVRYPSSVNSGGTLDLNGSIIPGTSFSELGIGGTGVGGNGALINSSASNAAWDGNSLFLIANARINCNGTGTLTIDTTNSPALNNPYLDLGTYGLTVGGVGDTFIYNIITSTNSSGTLTKDGTGTLQLLGANTYTGTTTIDAGTLILSGGAAIVDTGAVSLANVLGATLKLNASETIGSLSGGGTTGGNTNLQSFTLTTGDAGNATYGGVISGTGGLTKTGTGTLTLNGSAANTYTGLTTVSAGELDLNKTAGVNAIAGNLLISGTGTVKLLAADQIANTAAINMTSGTFTLNGMNETVDTLSNSGGVFTTGAGHLTGLGATVTWAGGTNTVNNGGLVADSHIVITGGTNTVQGGVTGGVLQLNSGGTGLEMTGATLTLNSDAATAGKLLLGGDVTTFASATSSNISNGLALANSGTIDLGGGTRTFTVADGAAANDLVIGAVIANGAVTKVGPGVLTFNGVNTYIGTTTINAGTLRAGNSNALGNGAGGVINNATLDVGVNSLNIGGVYNQADHSTLKLTIASLSSWGKIVSSADAVASVLSTVNVTIASGLIIPNNSTFTIIDGAGGSNVNVPGTIISNSSLFEFLGSVLNGDLILTAHYTSNSAPLYASLATSDNTRALGTVLDKMTSPTGDMTTVLNTLSGLSDAQAASALDTMGPIVDAGILNNSTAALNNFIGACLDREQEENKVNGIWAKEYGSYLDQNERKGIAGYNAWNAGTAIGVDRLLLDNFKLCASLGYAYGQVNSDANNAKTNIDSAQGMICAEYQDKDLPYFLKAAGSFAWNWYDGAREIKIGTIDRTAKADYDGQEYGVYFCSGYDFKLGKNIVLTYLSSLGWNHTRLAGYTETDAGAMDLRVNRQGYDTLQSGSGAKITSRIKYKWGNFIPELHAKWLHAFIGDDMAVTAAYTGGGQVFTFNGAKSAKDSANLGGKLFFDFKNDISLIAQCDTQIKSKFFGVYGSVTVRYRF